MLPICVTYTIWEIFWQNIQIFLEIEIFFTPLAFPIYPLIIWGGGVGGGVPTVQEVELGQGYAGTVKGAHGLWKDMG